MNKCERCGTFVSYNTNCYVPSIYDQDYEVCYKCFDDWHDNGHYEIWFTFYHADNLELADKFALDFLGRLG